MKFNFLAAAVIASVMSSCLGTQNAAQITCPIAAEGEEWNMVPQFSDDFEGKSIDETKWQYDMGPWGVRSWDKDCAVQEDGKLKLTMRYQEHDQNGTKHFYKVGIARSTAKTTYGYFEAKIKAGKQFPGACPAFWLYSSGEEMVHKGDTLTYSEIDIVELTQGEIPGSTASTIDCNLHMRLVKNGVEKWQRPETHPELCKTYWEADFDPRDDFHIYACENRPDSVIFYVDNKRIGAKKNVYWHLPMNLTFTIEPRMPHHIYTNGDRVPNPKTATPEGFPTTMEVEWVRAWQKK